MSTIRIVLLILLSLYQFDLKSQSTDRWYMGFGIFGNAESKFDFGDKVLTANLQRQFSFGGCFIPQSNSAVVYVSVGFKGIKANVHTPDFRESFLTDLKDNYSPPSTYGRDSLIGASMYNTAIHEKGYGLRGNYGNHIQVGFIWNKSKWKPSIQFTTGKERFCLFAPVLEGTVPEDPDYRFTTFDSRYYELKLGIGLLPVEAWKDFPFCLSLQVGYKWRDFGNFTCEDVSMDRYTSTDFYKSYQHTGMPTISLSLRGWFNYRV